MKPRLKEEFEKEVDEAIDKSNQEEADYMVSNLGRTIEKIQRNAIKRGLEKSMEEEISAEEKLDTIADSILFKNKIFILRIIGGQFHL